MRKLGKHLDLLQSSVAVCCSVLQCVAVCGSVLQSEHLDLLQCSRANRVKWQGTCKTLQHTATHCNTLQQHIRSTSIQSDKPCEVAQCCSVLQCIAVCCSVLQCVAVRALRSTSTQPSEPCEAAQCCSVLQCVAVCCSVLQCCSTHSKSADNSFKREVVLF